jgi:hypothetical protein
MRESGVDTRLMFMVKIFLGDTGLNVLRFLGSEEMAREGDEENEWGQLAKGLC